MTDICTWLFRSLQQLQPANIVVALARVLPVQCDIAPNVMSGDNRAGWGAELLSGREHIMQQVTHWT